MGFKAEQPRRGWRWRDATSLRFERRMRRTLVVVCAGLAVLVGAMSVVAAGSVGTSERAVFTAVNGLPDALHAPMWSLQVVGTIGFVAAASFGAFAVGHRRLGTAIGLAIPLKLATEWWGVKALVQRERPEFTVPDAIVRSDSAAPLGFPSGHSIFAFALAGLLSPYLDRRGTVAVYTLAVLNSLARVYLGAHNPLDVIAGAGLGVAIAAVLNVVVGTPATAVTRAQRHGHELGSGAK